MTKPTFSPLVITLGILGVLALSAFIYFRVVKGVDGDAGTDGPPTPPAGFENASETPPPPPVPDLPELEESDDLVRSLVQGLSENPAFAAWLVPDELVRRFVVAVDNVSRGESPRTHLGFLEPSGFTEPSSGNRGLVMNRRSYARYDTITAVFTSLDTAGGVRLYRQLEPLFDAAYQDLGYPGGDFDAPMAKAIDHILATPIPPGDVGLVRKVTTFEFSDPALEALSPAQKHFLRMGSNNMRQVHAKLRLMRSALNLQG